MLFVSLTMLCSHGYCRWSEICGDPKFSLLNKPFSDEVFMTDSKSRFLLKRFKVREVTPNGETMNVFRLES